MDAKAIFDNLGVAALASDADFNIIYINEAGKVAFKVLLNQDKVLGMNMASCHQPETMEKLKVLYQSFREKKLCQHHYVMDVPGGKATVVSVPFYNGDELGGVVEFVFPGTLG
jgi:hypothetical protein